MSIPFRTTSERESSNSCVHSLSLFSVSLFTRTNNLSVIVSSEGGRPAFFDAIVSPLFLVRTLIILLCAQKVNIFYNETQFISYIPICIPVYNQSCTCLLAYRIFARFSLCAEDNSLGFPIRTNLFGISYVLLISVCLIKRNVSGNTITSASIFLSHDGLAQ